MAHFSTFNGYQPEELAIRPDAYSGGFTSRYILALFTMSGILLLRSWASVVSSHHFRAFWATVTSSVHRLSRGTAKWKLPSAT